MRPSNLRGDNYYRNVVQSMTGKKDTDIEAVKIMNYDSKKQTATVYTLNSKQYRNDVPVMFSSVYLNTGILSPPVEGSTGFLFWSADRQPLLLPMQINLPVAQVEKGRMKLNAAPSVGDKNLTIENIFPGEHMVKSKGGSYVFVQNSGDVEVGTPNLLKLMLNQSDGYFRTLSESLDIQTDQIKIEASDDTETKLGNFKISGSRNTDLDHLWPGYTDDELIQRGIHGDLDSLEQADSVDDFEWQVFNVFDEDGTQAFDGASPLVERLRHTLENDSYYENRLTSSGKKTTVMGDDQTETEVKQAKDEITMTVTNKVTNTATTFSVDATGNVKIDKDNESLSITDMLHWFYHERV